MPAATKPKPVNLTQTSSFLRKTIILFVVVLVTIMVGRVALSSFVAYWKATHPEPPPAPTVGFGRIPAPVFEAVNDHPAQFRLELANGRFPIFTDRLPVFLLPTARASLLSADQAKRRAASMGYIFEPEIINERTYRWTNTQPLLSTLEMDILTGQFTITTNWAAFPGLLQPEAVLDPTKASNRIKALLQQSELLTTDFSTGPVYTQYLRASAGNFVNAQAENDAQFIQVNLARIPLQLGAADDPNTSFQIVTADQQPGPITAVLASNGSILEMSMQALPVDYQTSETYPLITATQAWQILNSGGGIIAQKPSVDEAIVRNVSLGYYDPAIEQPYFQPVFVFEGDDGFKALVPAVNPQYFQTTE